MHGVIGRGHQRIGDKRLGALSKALRHPGSWPARFVWDYSDSCHCAMGLYSKLWPDDLPVDNVREAAELFHMPLNIAVAIFHYAGVYSPFLGLFPRSHKSVKPAMVADLIDAYLEGRFD